MTNREWENLILTNKTAISDTVHYTCGSASLSCYDPDHGKIYSVYHASRTKYGEARDVFTLAIIPVCQPHLTENVIVAESGIPIEGITYRNIIDGNCIFCDGKVRIYFLSDGARYFYVDFFPENKTFSKIKPVLCAYDGCTQPLTDTAFAAYLDSRGMTGYAFRDAHEHVINTGKMYFYEGYWYGCLTSYPCQPVIYRSKDAETFELIGVIDKLAEYECQTAIVSGKLYCLLRGAVGDNFYVSDDLGGSFRPAGRIDFNTTRPQLMPYKGKLLMAVSLVGIQPNLVRDGRNNMKLLIGQGEDLTKYQEIFHITDPYGIVYYDIIDYKGVLCMLWSNADLYLDKNIQAKDLLYFAKIGDLSDLIG